MAENKIKTVSNVDWHSGFYGAIGLEFIENDDILDVYKKVNDAEYKGDKISLFNKIYNIDEIEIHLCDSLNRNIVDFLNNMFMFYGYIPNDYMKRRFFIDFEFDEYNESLIQNKVHQLLYKELYSKLKSFLAQKDELEKEIDNLYKEAMEKYSK